MLLKVAKVAVEVTYATSATFATYATFAISTTLIFECFPFNICTELFDTLNYPHIAPKRRPS